MTLVDEMMEKARKAQEQVADYNQEQVDALVQAMAKVVYDNAEELAFEAVEETGYGTVEAKTTKNTFFPSAMWHDLKGKPSVGVIERNEEKKQVKIAHPAGVVGSIAPVTVPNILPMGNALFAVKGRNAVIVSPAPKAKKSSNHTVDLMRDAIEKLGAPADLIQCVADPTLEISAEVMKKVDVVIATGGPGLVNAAYSSGTPAYSSGAGNAQLILEDTDDLAKFAEETIGSRLYDNGTTCVCTQALIYPRNLADDLKEEFTKQNTFWTDDKEIIGKFRSTLFDGEGNFNNEFAGKSALYMAEKAGVDIPEDTLIIALQVEEYGEAEELSTEKPAPIMVAIPHDGFDHAIEIANANLEVKGKGHTSGIYTSNEDHAIEAGIRIPVVRMMINQPTSDSGSGPYNYLNPSNSLGCGFWGGNSISENLNYTHLLNIQTVSFRDESKPAMPEYVWDN